MGSAKPTDEWESRTDHEGIKEMPSGSQPPTFPAQNYAVGDLKGRPIDKSKTGTWKAAPFIYAINMAKIQAILGLAINLVPYLVNNLHQSVSASANITTDFLGTTYILTVLGGFLADSYLRAFYTLCAGGVCILLGFGLLTFSTAYSGLQPAKCSPNGPCQPVGAHYMAPFYVAIYTIALGGGLVYPNNVSMGGDQFDDSSTKERKQSIPFFIWYLFSTNIGLLIAFALGVYLQDDVSRGWGYGFSLMLFFACFAFFILGANKFRHRVPTGSFLTRTAQVLVAAFRNWKAPAPKDAQELYNPTQTAGLSYKLSHTKNLRFLDKAAIINPEDNLVQHPNPWKLCSVSQVEESKRLVQLVPVWIPLAATNVVLSQLTTFSVQQGTTLDRKLGAHFIIPPASLSVISAVVTLVWAPIYAKLLVPLVRKYTKNPYGFRPLQRLGSSLVFGILAMLSAALVERKRLTYVRELHLQARPLGAYVLPMTFWWQLPVLFCSALMQFFLFYPSYEFFYHEAGETTRSIGSSFTYSANSLGNFFSTIIVNITNSVTRNDKSGSWLEGQLNDGGLEKFFWLLAVFVGVDFLLFLAAAHFYQYKYDWYHRASISPVEDDPEMRTISGRVGVEPP